MKREKKRLMKKKKSHFAEGGETEGFSRKSEEGKLRRKNLPLNVRKKTRKSGTSAHPFPRRETKKKYHDCMRNVTPPRFAEGKHSLKKKGTKGGRTSLLCRGSLA